MTVLAWLGTSLQIIGAIALAGRLTSPVTAYSIMLPGALAWLFVAVYSFNWPLATLQMTFAIINIVGIARWRA